MKINSGAHFRHYEIISPLGSGGMGEVYLAKDTRLGRSVALKVLIEELTHNPEHLGRFIQEARAASALNHPNIITVYEIGQFDDNHYIATEFIDGLTLRKLKADAPVEIDKIIDIVTQIATGLNAAHEAGIVHRDLKPENIMLRHDGYIKVLDFGLAKLAQESFNSDSDSSLLTISIVNTLPGTIMGTINYMSPEQLKGEVIDARADLWSLGVVFYELLTGRIPFIGKSTAEIIALILESGAIQLPTFEYPCSKRLRYIIAKCLMRDLTERYQSAAEMLVDLRHLKQELADKNISARQSGFGEESSLDLAPKHGGPDALNLSGSYSRPISKATPIYHGIWLYKKLLLAAVTVLCLYFGFRYFYRPSQVVSFGEASKLTDSGKIIDVALSPDGNSFAYVINEMEKQSLHIKLITSAEENSPIIPPANVMYRGMTFSPDGHYLYFIQFRYGENVGVLYQVTVYGGTPKKILEDVDTPVSFDSDGQKMAFVRGYTKQNETALVIANNDGSGEKIISTRKSPDDYGWRGAPAWSPHENIIVCAVGTHESNMGIVSINAVTGLEKPITSRRWFSVGRVAWLKDGSGLFLVARDYSSPWTQIWHVSYPDGQVRRVTKDYSDYALRSLSISDDGQSLATVHTDYISRIWLLPNADVNRAQQLTSNQHDGHNGLSWTPTGNLVYTSSTLTSHNIWSMDAKGLNQRQLTFDGQANYHPTVSPDGRFIIFTSTRTSSRTIWRMGVDGSNQKKLTDWLNATWPHCSPDNQWVIFQSFQSGKQTLWKVSVDGGLPTQLTNQHTGWPAVSPSGEYIACQFWGEQAGSRFVLAVIPFSGGTPNKTYKFPSNTAIHNFRSGVIRWKDKNTITYISNENGESVIWGQALSGEQPKQLVKINNDYIFWFDWTKDGKDLAIARGFVRSDAVLFRATKQPLLND